MAICTYALIPYQGTSIVFTNGNKNNTVSKRKYPNDKMNSVIKSDRQKIYKDMRSLTL